VALLDQMPPRKSQEQEIRAWPPPLLHFKQPHLLYLTMGVVNHVFDRRTGVVSAERCTGHLEYTGLNQSVRGTCLLQGAVTNGPEGTVKIDPHAGVVFSFPSCCPNWTSLFQREDRNGGIGHVRGTWRAQSCNLIAHKSRTAYAVVRWKLYSSYYYIFYFRFSLLISNTYFTHVHILNILYSTTRYVCVQFYRSTDTGSLNPIICRYYIVYILHTYTYTSFFTYKHLQAYPENDIILFLKIIKIHNIILKIYYIFINYYLNYNKCFGLNNFILDKINFILIVIYLLVININLK